MLAADWTLRALSATDTPAVEGLMFKGRDAHDCVQEAPRALGSKT